jgi:hypothetical protein
VSRSRVRRIAQKQPFDSDLERLTRIAGSGRRSPKCTSRASLLAVATLSSQVGVPSVFAQPRTQLIAPAVHQSGELEKLLVKEGLVPELPPLPEGEK